MSGDGHGWRSGIVRRFAGTGVAGTGRRPGRRPAADGGASSSGASGDQPRGSRAGRSPCSLGLAVCRGAGPVGVPGCDQGGGGAARPSAGGPAHPGGFVAVRDDRGHRQRPCGGPPVRRAHRLSMAVRRRRHERQDAGRLPGRPRHAPGAPAGRQLHRLGPGWRRQPGPDRPGRRPGARIGRSRLVPPRLDPGGVPERGRAGGARPARRGQWRSGRAQPGRQGAARQRAAEERERRVREALAVTRELRAQQEEKARREAERAARQAAQATAGEAAPAKERPKEPRASTTDAQARIMKMADGGYRPAYNVQFASDTRSGAIAGVSVDTVGSDMGKMAPMNEALAADYGQRPGQHLADGGFAKLADIADLAHAGGVVYVPTPRNAERDRYAPLPGDPPEVAAWRERMNTDDAKAIYKERAQTAECANAQARNRGLKQFLVRGLEAVTATALWYALAHNMACTWRLVWA